MEIPQEDDQVEAEKSNTEFISGFVKEDTFVIASDLKTDEKSSAQDLRHRKALALAKANARHVIKSWQKRHQILDRDAVRRSGTSRSYIQHISEAVQNDSGEKVYFRWEESGKIHQARQPKAVSKLYAYKRKRNTKKKTGLGDPESKSAPNRGFQDSMASASSGAKDLRIQTAVSNQQMNHDGDFHPHKDSSNNPDDSSTLGSFLKQTRKTKKVEFDLPPQTIRGIKEAFLSNSAKLQSQNKSGSGNTNAKNSLSGKPISFKSQNSDLDKATGDGQTDSDKENITIDAQLEHSGNAALGHVDNLEGETSSLNKQISPSSKNHTVSSVLPSRPRPPGIKHVNITTKDKKTNRKEPRPPVALPSKTNTPENNLLSQSTSKKNKKPSSSNVHHDDNLKPNIFQKGVSHGMNDVIKINDENHVITILKESASESSLKSLGNRKGRVVTENLNDKSDPMTMRNSPLDGKETSVVQPKNHDHKQVNPTSHKMKSKPNTDRVKTNISKSQRSPHRTDEPSDIDNTTLISINESSRYLKSNYDKSSYSIKQEPEMDRGHLNTIVESSLEPEPTKTNLTKNGNAGLLLSSHKLNDASDNDEGVNGNLPFNQTNKKSDNQPAGKRGKNSEDTTQLVSTFSKRQMTTMAGQSPEMEFDHRLSTSWPKRRGKSMQGRTLSRSDEKSYPTHRLDLASVVTHENEPNSPPLSIDRNHHHYGEGKGRGYELVGDSVSVGNNQNLSLSRKKLIDEMSDQKSRQTEMTDAVKAKSNVNQGHYLIEHVGTQSKHVGEDTLYSTTERISVVDGFQNTSNSDYQIKSNEVLQQQRPQIIYDSLPKTTKNSQKENIHSLNLDTNTAKFDFHDERFTSSVPQGGIICASDFDNGKVIDILKENGLESENKNLLMKENTGEGIVVPISSEKIKNTDAVTIKLNTVMTAKQSTLLDRPASAGMSQYLNRASPWMDENENIQDDDIKFINDEKDFYDVFGYDAETTELLQATQIFPVANFENLSSSDDNRHRSDDHLKQNKLKKGTKPAGGVTTHAELEEKAKSVNRLGQKKSKFHAKGASDVSLVGIVEKKDIVTSKDEHQVKSYMSQEEMKTKARERLLSLALRTESDDSLYRHGSLLSEGVLQYPQKATQYDTVFVSTESSSSTSSLLTSKLSPVGIPPNKNGDFPLQKANTSEIDLSNGLTNENEKLRRYSRKPSLNGVKPETRHIPYDELPFKRAPLRPPPSYQAEPPGGSEPTHHAHPQTRPHLPPKHANTKAGYLQRRRIFSESETDRKKMEQFTCPLKNLTPQEVTSMTSLYEKTNKSLAKNVGLGQNAPCQKKECPLPISQYPVNGSGQGQRGCTDTGQQFKKHMVHDVIGGTNATVLPFNYSETAVKVKSRLIEQTGHKQNLTGHNAVNQKISNIPNSNNDVVSRHLNAITISNNNKNVVKQTEFFASNREVGVRPTKPLHNQNRSRQNEDRPQNTNSNMEDHISLAKPRKLKPITHHPGIQKQHQHLASGL